MGKVNQEQNDSKKIAINNRKKLLISTTILLILIILVILIQMGYALFSDTKNDNVATHIGEIKVELKEDWPEIPDWPEGTPDEDRDYPTVEVGKNENGDIIEETYTEAGITKNEKSIYGHSVAEMDAYVRVRCIPIVQYFVPNEDGLDYNGETKEKGDWVTLPVSQNQINVITTSENNSWVEDGDYWYYTKILKAGEDTEKMNIKWEVGEIPNEVATYSIRTDVRVILEYAQTTNNMWKNIFQIEKLPDGVAVVE